MVNKNSGIQRQHPREDTHTHSVEQDQQQGMKNRGQNNEICHIDNTSCKNPPDITAQTL